MKINFIETASVSLHIYLSLSINQATYFDIIEEIAIGRRQLPVGLANGDLGLFGERNSGKFYFSPNPFEFATVLKACHRYREFRLITPVFNDHNQVDRVNHARSLSHRTPIERD